MEWLHQRFLRRLHQRFLCCAACVCRSQWKVGIKVPWRVKVATVFFCCAFSRCGAGHGPLEISFRNFFAACRQTAVEWLHQSLWCCGCLRSSMVFCDSARKFGRETQMHLTWKNNAKAWEELRRLEKSRDKVRRREEELRQERKRFEKSLQLR